MGGHYERGLYRQFEETVCRLEALEEKYKESVKTVKQLTGEVRSLRRQNAKLEERLTAYKEEMGALKTENRLLKDENRLLRTDNERMKRILNNNSSNSSLPPSTDEAGRAANTYNGRQKTKRKAGGQPGHKGHHLTREAVEKKIREGKFEYRLKEIGIRGRDYVMRYSLDLEIKAVATEIRIYADETGKFAIPKGMEAEVFYGNTIKAMAACLYSVGVVSNDRICEFLNSLSGGELSVSTGSIYGFCREFGEKCAILTPAITEQIVNAPVVCTDATTITTDGVQTYIRNFSTADSVLYCPADKKNLDTLRMFSVLNQYAGILEHDHETAMYNFGTGHAECNVHIARYLRKNAEETDNRWSQNMIQFLNGLNHARKNRMMNDEDSFSDEQIKRYEARYDEILNDGRQQNSQTRGKVAAEQERTLLNRLAKYKANHLLFLHNFQVPFSNNQSEKDLRICKNREKMAGGFRTPAGRQMYCNIMSVIETAKRRGENLFQYIAVLMDRPPGLVLA